MTTTPIESILVRDRQRIDLQDLDSLCDSIATYGLIHPIIVDQDNRLIAGGRRLAACSKLGWQTVPTITREAQSEAERQELELEENIRRADLHWHERALAVHRIHELRSKNAALDGETWTWRQTGSMLGMSDCNAWYINNVAERLVAGDEEVKSASNLTEAIRILVQRKERESARLLTERALERQAASTICVDHTSTLEQSSTDIVAASKDRDVITVKGDALEFLRGCEAESLDHIYTDPPYGIDMTNLEQDGGGMKVERVEAEHVVAENLTLISAFVPLAARALAPSGFLVMWCDAEHWQFLVDLGAASALRVQRWPLVWVKTHPCQNMATDFNFTKATELAIVMSKPKARLKLVRTSNWWLGKSDKADYGISHPFWKPLALHRWVIEAIALPGESLLDPFAGAGSIPRAASYYGCRAIGVELNDMHYAEMLTVLAK